MALTQILKELMESKNKELAAYVEKKILKRLCGLAEFKKEIQSSFPSPGNEEKGKDVLKQYYPYSDETYSVKFFILNLECIQRWAKIFPSDFSESTEQSKFLQNYQTLKAAGILFPNAEPDIFPKRPPPTNTSLTEQMIESLGQQQINSISILKKDCSTDTIKLIYQKSLGLYQQFSEQIDKVMDAPSSPSNEMEKERLSNEILFLSQLQSFYNSLVNGKCTIKDFLNKLVEVSETVQTKRKSLEEKLAISKNSDRSGSMSKDGSTSLANPALSQSTGAETAMGKKLQQAILKQQLVLPSVKYIYEQGQNLEEEKKSTPTANRERQRNQVGATTAQNQTGAQNSTTTPRSQQPAPRDLIKPVLIYSKSGESHQEADAEKEDIDFLADESNYDRKNSDDLTSRSVQKPHPVQQSGVSQSSLAKKSLVTGPIEKSGTIGQSELGQKADMFAGTEFESRIDSKSRVSTYKGGPAPSLKILGGDDWIGNFTGSTKAFVIENVKDQDAQKTIYHSSKQMTNSQVTGAYGRDQSTPATGKKHSDSNQLPPLAPKQSGSLQSPRRRPVHSDQDHPDHSQRGFPEHA